MKKIRLDIRDLLVVLEAMMESGTTEIIIFDHEGAPAIVDADEPDNIIGFQIDEENEDGDPIH
jgi:hypothetical protein